MKTKIAITAFAALLGFTSTSQAGDLIQCRFGPAPMTNTLRVYETPAGYAFEATKFVQSEKTQIAGTLNRDFSLEAESLDRNFYSERFRIFDVFRAILVTQDGKVFASFNSTTCKILPGSDVVGRGSFPGFCAYAYVAQSAAEFSARKKCGGKPVVRVSVFRDRCYDAGDGDGPSLHKAAIFRCQ
jgi:hypothetical protein